MSAYQKLGGEIAIDLAFERYYEKAEVTVLADGRFVVIWADRGLTTNSAFVKAQIFAADGTPQGGTLALAGPIYTAYEPTITALAGGGFVAVWSRGVGGSVDAQIFDGSGVAVGSVFAIPLYLGAEIAALPGGGFAVVSGSSAATGGDTSEWSVHLRTYGANGAAVSGDVLVNTTTAGSQSNPYVASLAGGGLVVTWTDREIGGGVYDNRIMAQVFDVSGAKVGAELVVSQDEGLYLWSSPVTALPNGNFAVSWLKSGPGYPTVMETQIVTATGAPVGAPIITPYRLSGGATGEADIAALADGSIAIVWMANGSPTSDGSGRGVFVQVYGADGTPITPEMLINTQVSGDQVMPTIAARADGGFVVTWTDFNGAGGDDDQVKVQVFGPIETAPVVITSNGGGASAAVSIGENVSVATTVAATGGVGALSYAIAGGADAGRFSINRTTGVLSIFGPPNYEAPTDANGNNVYEVVVSVNDGMRIDTQALAVTVQNLNDNAPVLAGVGTGSSVIWSHSENVQLVRDINAPDADGDPVTFSLSGTDAARFTLDPTTGVLQFISAPNYEAPTSQDGSNTYRITVTASDGVNSDFSNISIMVSNVAEALAITSNGGDSTAAVTVAENGQAVTTVVAHDPDLNAPTYWISGGADAARFAIDATTGALRFVSAPNFEAPSDVGGDNVYNVTVGAGDGTSSDSQAIAVTVSDSAEAPVITSNGGGGSATVSLNENTSAVTTVAASDDESGVTYALAGGADVARFAISASTGALSFVAAPDFEAPTDADGDNVYEVIVRASDGALEDLQTIAVTVANVNLAPVILSNGGGASAAIQVAAGTTAVTSVTATDLEGPSPVTYSIAAGDDAARFAINASTGALSFVTAPIFEAPADADGNNVYEVVVSASDGSLVDNQTIFVTVANVNQAPVITSNGGGSSAAISMGENATFVTTVTSTDPENSSRTYSIAGGADASRFTINAATGTLSFLSAPDREAPADIGGNNIYDVIVRASDGSLSDTQAIAVTITNVNEAPVITSSGGGSSAAISVNENTFTFLTVTSTDPENTARTYSIAGGADAARFTISSTSGTLSFVSAPNREAPTDVGGNNVYDVIVRASDGSLSDTQAIAVTVANVNEAPVITSNGGSSSAAISVSENTFAVTTVTSTDPENTARTYSISGGVDAARFTINATTGALSFVGAPNFESPTDVGGNNVYDVSVRASDGSLTDTQVIAVTITNVDEAPVITSNGGGSIAAVSVIENATSVTTVASTDPESTARTYAIVGGADAARFAIDAVTGALSFANAPDYEAPADADGNNIYEVSVSASDGSLADTQALSVSVVNLEGLTINSNGAGDFATVWVAEDSLAVTTVTATGDLGGSALVYAIAGGADAARFSIDAITGALTFVAAPNFEAPADAGANNVYDVVVSASGGAFSDTQSIAVAVTDRYEGPTVTYHKSGPEFFVNNQLTGNQTVPSVASFADGSFVVVWGSADSAQDGSDSAIKGQRFDAAGNPVGSEFLVNSATQGTQFTPEVRALGDGKFVVAWATGDAAQDGSGNAIKAQLFGSDGARIGGEFLVNTQASGSQFAPSVAALSNGGFVISWDDGGSNDQKAQLYGGDGATIGGEFTLNTATAMVQDYGDIAALAGGGFVATWFTADSAGDGNSYAVKGQVFAANGVKLGDEFRVNTNAFGEQQLPSVTALEGGGFAVAWVTSDPAQDGSSYAIKAQIFSAVGMPLGGEFLVNIQTANLQNFPVTTSLPGGGFFVAWYTADPAQDGSSTAVKGQVFSATGVKIGPELLVNTLGAGQQFYPELTTRVDGSIVATWVTSPDGFAGFEIKGQIFRPNDAPIVTSNGGSDAGSVNAAENGIEVATLTTLNAVGPLPLRYAIVGGADAGQFAIDVVTGVLRFVAAPNFEAPTDSGLDNMYEVTVSVTDGELTDTQAIAVTVTDVNEALSITSNGAGNSATVSMSENTTFVTTVTSTDPENSPRTYSLVSGQDSAHFTINATTGVLSFVSAPNFEAASDAGGNNVYDVVVSASDGSFIDTQALTVTVGNINEAPTAEGALADVEVDTGAAFTFGIAGVSFSDVDGDALTLSASLTDGSPLPSWITFNGTSFSGTAPTGTGNFEIKVRASDGSAEASVPFTLNVTQYNYISGTAGGGSLTGTSGRDHMTGLAGQDTFAPGAGADYVNGGSGSDAVSYSSAPSGVSLSLTSGGTGGEAAGDTYVDIERAIGSAFADFLEGSSVANVLSGGGGNDTLRGLAGNDTLNGEGGSDILYGGDGIDSLNQGDWNDGAADQLFGEAGDDFLKGGAYDVLEGGAGADQLELTGNYMIARGSGAGVVADSSNSIIIAGNLVGIEVDGGRGSDTLYQQNGYDVRYASLRNVEVISTTSYLSGENSATMTIDFTSLDLSGSLVYGNLDIVAGLDLDTVIKGPARGGTSNTGNVLRIYGAGGNDTLTGNAAPNTIGGEGGNDAIYGGAGSDSLSGGDGDDTIYGEDGIDDLIGGAGADALDGGAGSDRVNFYWLDWSGAHQRINPNAVHVDFLDPGSNTGIAAGDTYTSIENIDGTNYADWLGGDNNANVINGNGNNDTIYGRGGDDNLQGGAGADTLYGDGGADILNGGAGADQLTGGTGADTFAYTALADSIASATDLILDFARAQADKISLSAIDANSQLGGDQAFSFIGTSAFSGTAGQLHFYQSGGDTFVEGDVNGDGIGDFLIGIDQAITLLSSDFVL